MKRFVLMVGILASVLLSGTKAAQAATFTDETLNYEIVYHWGLIWKHAASATLSLRGDGDRYVARLAAHTVSWADKVYPVRDTLTCDMTKNGLRPVRYVKSSHEDKYHELDIVQYSYNGNETTGNCTRIRRGSEPEKSVLKATGQAYDMLSVFYHLRSLDFNKMNKTVTYRTTVMSGRKKENLNIKFVAVERIQLRDKSWHNAYHIKFTFTQDGQTKSSDDIDTWISATRERIPLLLRGNLPIGEVRCYYKK